MKKKEAKRKKKKPTTITKPHDDGKPQREIFKAYQDHQVTQFQNLHCKKKKKSEICLGIAQKVALKNTFGV